MARLSPSERQTLWTNAGVRMCAFRRQASAERNANSQPVKTDQLLCALRETRGEGVQFNHIAVAITVDARLDSLAPALRDI